LDVFQKQGNMYILEILFWKFYFRMHQYYEKFFFSENFVLETSL